jgi:hypothetical protein
VDDGLVKSGQRFYRLGIRTNNLRSVDRRLQAAASAYFSSKGFYIITDMELPKGYDGVADVAGVRPILREMKKRSLIGPAPAGVIYLLDTERWTPTEKMIEATGSNAEFIRGVLMEAEQKGWIEKNIVAEDDVHWRLKDYVIPARDSLIVRCGSTDPVQALEDLQKASGCCQRSYLVLDYEVDTDFIDLCFKSGIGLLIFSFRNGYFKEILTAEDRGIKDRKGLIAFLERVMFENYVLLREDGI